MLTDAEKKWLEERDRNELAHSLYSCIHCDQFSHERDEFSGHCAGELKGCPLYNGYRTYLDAAEFEARVAAKLANRCSDTRPCISACKTCEARRLKHARIAVERDMEAERELKAALERS